MKTDFFTETAKAQNIISLVEKGDESWTWADNPQNSGRLVAAQTRLASKVSPWQQRWLAEDVKKLGLDLLSSSLDLLCFSLISS